MFHFHAIFAFEGRNTISTIFKASLNIVQYTLGFATMGLAANLDIATATSLTDLPHYIIATMDITTSNFCTYIAK